MTTQEIQFSRLLDAAKKTIKAAQEGKHFATGELQTVVSEITPPAPAELPTWAQTRTIETDFEAHPDEVLLQIRARLQDLECRPQNTRVAEDLRWLLRYIARLRNLPVDVNFLGFQ